MIENNIIIDAENITKKYTRGSEDILALNTVSLKVQTGDFISFLGPSGSGKTTLINILGCLDNPSSGRLTIAGNTVFSKDKVLSETAFTKIRREYFGYIFQSFYLIPTLTVYESTILPLTFSKKTVSKDDVMKILEMLGLGDRINHLPSQLSGGEMQRVAIARAIINKPRILFADEPTGNLDTKRSGEIGDLLKRLNKNEGLTIIMVTHNTQLAESAGRIVNMRDGTITL
ncbi:MAG: ABC transporter ATP-binding protein [Elusimicrobiota bacterium]